MQAAASFTGRAVPQCCIAPWLTLAASLLPCLQPRVASTEAIATWNELSRCPYIKETKTIVHPGEVGWWCREAGLVEWPQSQSSWHIVASKPRGIQGSCIKAGSVAVRGCLHLLTAEQLVQLLFSTMQAMPMVKSQAAVWTDATAAGVAAFSCTHACELQVNKIREVPQHPEVVVTHTDAPELYVWNTNTQPNASRDKVMNGCCLCQVFHLLC